WNDSILFDDDYSVTHSVLLVIPILQVVSSCYTNIISNTTILIQDSLFDIASFSHTYRGRLLRMNQLHYLIEVFVIVGAHHVCHLNDCTAANPRTDADNRSFYFVGQDNTPISDNCIIQGST